LAVRLEESEDEDDWSGVALILAVMVWQGGVIKQASGMSWQSYADRDPEYPARIINTLKHYFPTKIVPILWASHGASYLNTTFVETLIGYAVQKDMLGDFDPLPVQARLHEYCRAVPFRQRDAFLAKVHQRRSLLSSIEAEPLGPQLAEAVNYMTRRGGLEAEKAIDLIRERVRSATPEEWSRAIREGIEPYSFSLRLAEDSDLKFDGRSALCQALRETVPVLIADGNREIRDRWFKLLELMRPKQARALQQSLAAALGDAAPDWSLKILMTGGAKLLKAGGFASDADRAIRNIIMPQLDRKEGRDWLRENHDELTAWLRHASESTRVELKAHLKSMEGSKLQDRRYTADYLLARWPLN
jgi:hypothetical protein